MLCVAIEWCMRHTRVFSICACNTCSNDCFWSRGLCWLLLSKGKKWVMLSGWLQTHMHPPFSLHGQTRSIALQGICGSACFSFQSCQFSGGFELQKKKLAWKLKGVYRLVWSLIAHCLFMQSICSEVCREAIHLRGGKIRPYKDPDMFKMANKI